MDSRSAVGVAHELGTNVPRLLRAADRLGLHPSRKRGGHLQFGSAEVARLRAELGVTARIGGLRRIQVQVLAALIRAPLGLRSGRAVARAAGLSATAATRALRDLFDAGLVEVRRETVAEGTAKRAEIAYANHTHPRWPELAPQLARVVAPAHARHGRCTVLADQLGIGTTTDTLPEGRRSERLSATWRGRAGMREVRGGQLVVGLPLPLQSNEPQVALRAQVRQGCRLGRDRGRGRRRRRVPTSV